MAKFLAEAVETASRYPEVHVVICEALVKLGLRSSTWLPSNHTSVAVMYTVGVIFGAKGICTVGSMHIR